MRGRLARGEHDQKPRFDADGFFHRPIGLAKNALGAVPHDGTAELFGDGKAYAVDPQARRMRAAKAFCKIVRQNIDSDTACDGAFSFGICLGIQMIFTDCSEFQSYFTCLG